MSDPKEPERRVFELGFIDFVGIAIVFLVLIVAASRVRYELARIAAALERAHPAPEVGK